MFRSISVLAVVLVIAVLQAPRAFAQNFPADYRSVCSAAEEPVTVRVNTIKPGKMQDFMAAVQAHQAWYKNLGYPDVIYAAKVVVQDPATHTMKFSDTTVLTFHIASAGTTAPKHDAGYDAYAKMYSDSSEVKETYITCSPKTQKQ